MKIIRILQKKYPQYNFILKWSKIRRCNFIPFGAISYIDWNQYDSEWYPSRVEENLWIFQCSLKNFNNEIETFMDTVLIYIAKEVKHLEIWFEYWEKSKILTGEFNKRLGIINPLPIDFKYKRKVG